MDTSVALSEGRRRRRKHSAEFKAQVIAACCKPGVSSASVAMANGINANLVRRWVKESEAAVQGKDDEQVKVISKRAPQTPPRFVPLALPAAATAPDIKIEVQRGSTKVVVSWPATAAAECATWMRELLR